MENLNNHNNNLVPNQQGQDLGESTAPMKKIRSVEISRAKYDSVYALAQQGFKVEDVIEVTPQSIGKMNKGILPVTVGTKTVKIPLEQALVFAEYMRDNEGRIKECGYVFFGKKGKLDPRNLSRDFGSKLKKYHGKTLFDVNWQSANAVTRRMVPVVSEDDVNKILESLQKRN